MPAFDADLDLTNASAKPNYIPVHTDGTTICHDGNDATIAGALHTLELWMTRTQRFTSLIKNYCVSSDGYIYVDDIRAIPIITGTIPDGADRNISRPCPPTAARVTSIALSEYSAGRAVPSFPTTVPDHLKKLYVVNHMRVDEEKASLLQSLAYMFKKADWCDELCENSAGDGLAFLTAVIERGKRASIKDKTAAVALFDAIKRGGVVGEITLESFSTFLKAYRQGLRTLDPATLPSDATESQMVSAIALKDPALRELYEIKAELKPPSNLTDAAEIVKSILRSHARSRRRDPGGGHASRRGPRSRACTAPASRAASHYPRIARDVPRGPGRAAHGPFEERRRPQAPRHGERERGQGAPQPRQLRS